MHFEFALGAYDSTIYCKPDALEEGDLYLRDLAAAAYSLTEEATENHDAILCLQGKVFMIFFNSANMVLMLNLIIAILSSTYAFYEDKKTGLYYEVLISKLAELEFDERYGAAACAKPPINLMIAPLQWILIFECFSDEFLLYYNHLLCHLLYFPVSIFFTVIFAAVDIFCAPFAYLITSYRLLMRIPIKEEYE